MGFVLGFEVLCQQLQAGRNRFTFLYFLVHVFLELLHRRVFCKLFVKRMERLDKPCVPGYEVVVGRGSGGHCSVACGVRVLIIISVQARVQKNFCSGPT